MWRVFVLVFSCGLVAADFIPDGLEEVTSERMKEFGAFEKCGEGAQLNLFKCVPYHRCDPETNTTLPEEEEIPLDYSVLIDIRLGHSNACEKYLDVCCKIAENQVTPSPRPTPTTEEGQQPNPSPPTPVQSHCGIRNINGIDFKITGASNHEAEYGEFPWMVAIIKTNYDPNNDKVPFVCGGSMIAPRVIITGAHCVNTFKNNELKVRAGEWDTQTINERYPYQEQNVAQIIIHEKFRTGVLFNNIALLVLEAPFTRARHIGTVCLSDQDQEIDSKECFATGWGKDFFGLEGHYQSILKKIELPTVPHQQCEEALQGTKLGKTFILHESFRCAGGIEGKDTCTGDGGSPLVCPDPKNPSRYVQAGIVAWGIECGNEIPGVYANVAKFRNWVDGKMQGLNLGDKTYTE